MFLHQASVWCNLILLLEWPMRMFFRRITGRLIELELLFTSGLLLAATLSMLLLVLEGELHQQDLVTVGAFIGMFMMISLALALRGWGEDQVMLPITALLAGVGMIMARRLEPDLTLRYANIYGDIGMKQVLWVLCGVVVVAAINFLPWRMSWLKHYRYSWLLLGMALVGITFVIGVGRDDDTRLWLDLGIVQLQPVEVLKMLLVVYLATYLDRHRDVIGRDYYLWGIRLPPVPYLLPLLVMWGLTMALIIVQRDLGAALLVFSIFLAMLYLLTGRTSYVTVGLVSFAAGAAALYPFFSHVRVRLSAWYDPWVDPIYTGYQMVQSLYALAHGGYIGTGLGLGDPTMIPESHTDFIFIAIGEELGMVGALGLLLCYALFAFRGYQIAWQARDGFQQLLAAGLTTAIAMQALIITAGTTNLVPLTGITLPFLSYGGSSTMINFTMVGLLLRISATNKSPRVL